MFYLVTSYFSLIVLCNDFRVSNNISDIRKYHGYTRVSNPLFKNQI